MSEWVTTTVGAAAALIGVVGGYGGARAIYSRQRADARLDALQGAVADFLGCLYIAVGRLQQLPSPPDPDSIGSQLARAIEWLKGEHVAWAQQEKALREVFGPEPFRYAEDVMKAASRLQVMSIPDVLDRAVSDAMDYLVEISTTRDPATVDRWSEVRAHLLEAIHESGVATISGRLGSIARPEVETERIGHPNEGEDVTP